MNTCHTALCDPRHLQGEYPGHLIYGDFAPIGNVDDGIGLHIHFHREEVDSIGNKGDSGAQALRGKVGHRGAESNHIGQQPCGGGPGVASNTRRGGQRRVKGQMTAASP